MFHALNTGYVHVVFHLVIIMNEYEGLPLRFALTMKPRDKLMF